MCIEAGFVGTPVVATRVGAVPGIISEGVTGSVVEFGDTDALVAALEQIRSWERPETRSSYLDRYEIRAVAAAWEALLHLY